VRLLNIIDRQEAIMKKTPLLVCTIILLLAAAVVVEAAVIRVTVQTANVRQKADINSPILSRVSMGATFEATKKVGNFYEISIKDNAGNFVTAYISADVVEEVSTGALPVQPTVPAQARPTQTAPYASRAAAGGIIVGVGAVLSNLTYDKDSQAILDQNNVSKKMRFGFQVGAGYEIPFSENFSIVPGIYYSTAGSKLEATFEGTTYTDTLSMSGIVIPIDLKLSFNGPFVAVGPYLGFILSAKDISSPGETTDVLDEINKVHFGFSFGGGIELNMGSMTWVVKAAYQLGFTNLHKAEDASDTLSMKHNAIIILAGIKL
jgi:opacity protein-like surface antigen